MTRPHDQSQPWTGIDLTVLDLTLSVGGVALRPALVAQVLDDLARLRAILAVEAAGPMAPAAHELCGIAATLGAGDLADAAARLDTWLQGGGAPAGGQIAEICRLVDDLADCLRRELPAAPALA